jgi:hypothetical protein
MPDRIDPRDWKYRPSLRALPDTLVNVHRVPKGGILNQGEEGACTGFALAATINFLLHQRQIERRVSPRMLYEMARQYDEWPGRDYDGSSGRGAMKGWFAHGVCSAETWPARQTDLGHFTQDVAEESRGTPGGAFYRVMHREIRDMHAALAEVGILYVTLMVHEGWGEPGPDTEKIPYLEDGKQRTATLPVIQRKGRADDAHAVAIVGYGRTGFIVQNSWGESWGAKGFALLPYEDYMLHATDVWVAQLGVPISLDLWRVEKGTDSETGMAGIQRATQAVPLAEIRPYVIDVGNDGKLSRRGEYWTTTDDVRRLFTELIPKESARWSKHRVMLYLHGGLNDEAAVARRIVAFREVCLANEIYPLHIMWETGMMETLRDQLEDLVRETADRAGSVGQWMTKLRDGLVEAKDRSIELTTAGFGRTLWNEMKKNAALIPAPNPGHPDDAGAIDIVAARAKAALAALSPAEQSSWELHVVAHSAGSIVAAYALERLLDLGSTLKTIQFMAPAISVDLFKKTVLPLLEKGDARARCPQPTLYVLSDVGERDDTVGPYGKSLLYLVSNAFEDKRSTPILGMERFISDRPSTERDGPSRKDVDDELNALYKKTVDGLPSLVVAGVEPGGASTKSFRKRASSSTSDSHGGFDNDPATLNSVLRRILGTDPTREFQTRDLQY